MFTPRWYTLFLLALLVQLPQSNKAQSCSKGVEIRREWRSLSNPDKQSAVKAVSRFIRTQHSEFVRFARMHNELGSIGIHGTGQFCPWHRKFVMDFQESVRKNGGNSSYIQHYWDATPRSQEALRDSPIFHSVYGFGPLTTECVSFDDITSFNDNSQNCVRRGRGNFRFDSISTVHNQINISPDFASFTASIEGGYHGQVHVSVGGQMGTYDSPIDPIFFFHHCMIDRFWALWQSRDFTNRLLQYNSNTGFPQLERLDSVLLGYPGVTVRSIMDISELCYAYDDVPVKPGPPIPPINPPVTTTTTNPTTTTTSPPTTTTTTTSRPPTTTTTTSRPPTTTTTTSRPPTTTTTTSRPSTTTTAQPPPTPTPIPSTYLVLPGLPEGVALNTEIMDPTFVKSLRASSSGTIRNNLPLLQQYFVTIPRLPPRPTWCLILPGIPKGKCIDTRTMDKQEVDWWLLVSLDYIEKYWTIIIESVVPIPATLSRRSNANAPKGKGGSSSEASSNYNGVAKSPKGGPKSKEDIDLGEICLLKYSTPLPDNWIEMNKLNASYVRESESKRRQFVDKLNNFEGFLPESAPVNNPEVLQSLIEAAGAGPGNKVNCLAKGIKIVVPYHKDAAATARRLCELAQRTGRKGYSRPTPKDLVKLIGMPLFNPSSISNPFHQCSNEKYGY